MPFLSVWDRKKESSSSETLSTKGNDNNSYEDHQGNRKEEDPKFKKDHYPAFISDAFDKSERSKEKRIAHTRITLDQFYYATIADTSGRDNDQVLSRYLQSRKEGGNTKENHEKLNDSPKKDDKECETNQTRKRHDKKKPNWPWEKYRKFYKARGNTDKKKEESDRPQDRNKNFILAVDQLWLWVIDDKTIITATTEPSKGADDILLKHVMDSLVFGESNGTFHRPMSVWAMMEFILGTATELFIKQIIPISNPPKGVLDVFDETIRAVADREMQHFEKFNNSLKKDERGPHEKTKRRSHNPNDRAASRYINSISEEMILLREVKDIGDELNILKTLAEAQETVWEEAFSVKKSKSGNPHFTFEYVHDCKPSTVKADLDKRIKHIHEIQSLIHALLDLRQKQASLNEAEFGGKQAKTVLVFTAVTVVFLPLSFLTSLFALNIKEFPHQGDDVAYEGRWIFPILFGTTIAVLCPCVLVAFKIDAVRDYWEGLLSPTEQTLEKSTKPPVSRSRVFLPGLRLLFGLSGRTNKSPNDEENGNCSVDTDAKGEKWI